MDLIGGAHGDGWLVIVLPIAICLAAGVVGALFANVRVCLYLNRVMNQIPAADRKIGSVTIWLLLIPLMASIASFFLFSGAVWMFVLPGAASLVSVFTLPAISRSFRAYLQGQGLPAGDCGFGWAIVFTLCSGITSALLIMAMIDKQLDETWTTLFICMAPLTLLAFAFYCKRILELKLDFKNNP